MPAPRTIVVGWTPAEDRAVAAGAAGVPPSAADVQPAAGAAPGVALRVVDNKRRGPLSGRLLGSVPFDVALRSGVDVLVDHTS